MLSLFQFFMKCFLRSKRMLWLVLLGLVPVFYVFLVYLLKPIVLSDDFLICGVFPKLAFSMYLHFLLPLMSVFIGTSVIMDEVESATLPYLLVRPIPRWQIAFAKTLVGEVLLAIILCGSLFISYGLMSLDGEMIDICSISTLMSAVFVLAIGCFAYVPLFSFLGGLIKKPVLSGLLFTFGWEKIVGSLPGSLRFTTLITYLNSMFPFKEKGEASGVFSLLRATATILTTWKAIFVLIGLMLIFHWLTTSLLSWKEYAYEEE
ncbi:ABC transporter permease [bacterium]|nr:ABC transporter permease [bacterium]